MGDEVFEFCFGVGKDQNVVHIHDYTPFMDFLLKDKAHHGLEGSRRVGKFKKHNSGLEQFSIGDKSCLPLVTVFYLDIVIAPLYIDLGEVFGTFKFVKEVGDL
jgi:hypothetical protein